MEKVSNSDILNLFLYFECSDDVREKMKTRYLSNPDYNFEKVNRASMACGPMVKWAIAQVRYYFINYIISFFQNHHQIIFDEIIKGAKGNHSKEKSEKKIKNC